MLIRRPYPASLLSLLLLPLLAACSGDAYGNAVEATSAAVDFQRVYPLAPSEGVFAYSRISPDGKTLAYASETRTGGRLERVVTVVDLATKKVTFTEPGIDAYFSNDNQRMIYLAQGGNSSVVIRHQNTGQLTRNVAPVGLGDYFSWAVRDGRNLILTINGNYYYLNGDRGEMPHGTVNECPGIGAGDRPLISKDGRRITTFVRGTIVVRGLDNCNDVIDTGIEGGKADFSFDNRYIAMHATKPRGTGSDVYVVDLRDKTVRNITSTLSGSSLFPSWTSDGRLSFRYDGSDYRGFMFASNVLSATSSPLPRGGTRLSDADRDWVDIFPETAQPKSRMSLVLVWGTWGAHSHDALRDLQSAEQFFRDNSIDVSVMTATDPLSREADIARMMRDYEVNLRRITLAPERLRLTEMNNQNPTTLLFRDGRFVGRKMGAQTATQLRQWVMELGAK